LHPHFGFQYSAMLKRFYRDSRLCAVLLLLLHGTNSRIYDNFQQWTAVFIGRCPLFAPRRSAHRAGQSESERDRRLRVLLCPWTRAANTKTSQLSRRVSVWLVFLVLHQYVLHLHAIASLSAVFSALFAAGLTTHDF
jgi:hypothetical protein